MGNVEEGEARCGAMGMDQEGRLRKRTVGGQEEDRERQKRERLGLRDKGKSTNMQMCKEGISTSLGVLSKREA